MSVQIIYEATATGAAYGTVSGVFKQISADWSSLDDTGKVSLYQTVDEGNAELSNLVTLGKFIAHAYITGENVVGIGRPTADGTGEWTMTTEDGEGVYSPTCIVTAVPKVQVVKPKSLLPLDDILGISNVSIVGAVDSVNKITLALTDDLENYKTYNFETSAWESIDITSTDAMIKSGIPMDKVSSIPQAAWDNVALSGFGLAYCLQQTKADTDCNVNRLQVTATLSGRWNHAVYGTDYYYGYTSNTTLQVTFLESGSFKINYSGADTSKDVVTAQEPIGIGCNEGTTDAFTYVNNEGGNL